MSTKSLRSGQRPGLPPELGWAIEAVQDKKAADVTLLDLRELGAFTELFLLCTGSSARQVQAISDAVEKQLGSRGIRPAHCEGYPSAEWVLLDYDSFIVHVFSERARQFYDLERLWRAAPRTNFPGPDTSPGAGPA